MNPRKMQQMMEQFGIDVEDVDATEVVIRTPEGDLVFDDPSVTKMDARGQETYQVLGEGRLVEGGTDEGDDGAEAETEDAGDEIPESDIEIVAGRTGASPEEAREALVETDGDLAAAVDLLE